MKKIFTMLSVAVVSLLSAQNLVVNPGFESWDAASGTIPAKPTSWFVGTSGTITQEKAIVHGGTSSAKTVSPATGNSSLSQDIAAQENTQYTLGYWVLDNDANARGRHWVQARTATANITWSSSFQPSTYTSDNPAWTYVTATATTPATTTVLRFDYRNYGQNGNVGAIYLDDVVLVQGTLAVTDVKEFDNQVKMNTVVENELTLKLPRKATVNIYAVDGRLISSNRVNDGGSVNMSSVPKGNYIVSVDDGSTKISRKIIKK